MTDKTGDDGGPVVQSLVSIYGEVQKIGGVTVGVVVHTCEEWQEYGMVISIKGCLYVYSDYRKETVEGEIINIPRIKVGDGMAYITDLPFSTMSLTDEDINKFKDHVGVVIDDSMLVFYH